jgi:hypothetical protein
VTRHRRDAAVNRLTDLTDHHQVIDASPAQGTEPVFPRLGQGAGPGSKIAWNLEPMKSVAARVIRGDFIPHVFAAKSTSNGKMRNVDTMFFGD